MNINYDNLIKTDILNLEDDPNENDDLNQSFYETNYQNREQDDNDNKKTNENRDESDENEQAKLNINTMKYKNGILDKELIINNLKNISKSADGSKLVYLELKIPGYKLEDINELKEFNELQTLDISFNLLNNLSVISSLPYLVYINASNNSIQKLFDFLPPYYLKYADFSFNTIQQIDSLINYHYLQHLDLNRKFYDKSESS